MRFGYERLGGIVRERMQAEPRSRALFVFVGKRGHTMKVLTWDGTGAIVVHKKLDAGKFEVPKPTRVGDQHVIVSDAIFEVNLTHENQLLKRRIYGNKTERSQTSELQLSLGDLFEAEKQLQKQLDRAVAHANDQTGDGTPPETPKPKTKPSGTGRRDWLVSDLPRSSFDVLDPELERCRRLSGSA